MNIFNMNSVPVFVTNLLNDERITEDEYEILTSIQMEKREEDKTYSTQLSKSSHILDDSRLSKIKETKLKYIDHYLKNIVGVNNNFSMTSSWLTLNQNGSAHERHSHGNVILSCVLYFCENLSDEVMASFYLSQKGTDFIFQNFQFQYDIRSYNEYNSPSLSLPTRTNLLVIFPGWMLHGSEPTKNTTKRYCIGSNYFLNDHVGSGYHSLSIEAKIKDLNI